MSSITVTDVKGWIGGLVEAGLAPATVRKCYQLAAQVMAEAVDTGIIARHHHTARHTADVEHAEPAVLLTPEQVEVLAAKIDPRYKALVLTCRVHRPPVG